MMAVGQDGGYYGGLVSSYDYGAGGGSGYISNTLYNTTYTNPSKDTSNTEYNGNGHAKITLISTIYNFEYEGNTKSVNLTPGEYKLEVWGANGGDCIRNYNCGNCIKDYTGGNGGYSSGVLKIEKNTIVYICVGGKGESNSSDTTKESKGGYNGGGNGSKSGDNRNYVQSSGGGGGATHISTSDGVLASLASNSKSVIIVAGGGGGAGGWNENSYDGSCGGARTEVIKEILQQTEIV